MVVWLLVGSRVISTQESHNFRKRTQSRGPRRLPTGSRSPPQSALGPRFYDVLCDIVAGYRPGIRALNHCRPCDSAIVGADSMASGEPEDALRLMDSLPKLPYQEIFKSGAAIKPELRAGIVANYEAWKAKHEDLDATVSARDRFTQMAGEALGADRAEKDMLWYYSVPSIIMHGKPHVKIAVSCSAKSCLSQAAMQRDAEIRADRNSLTFREENVRQ
jgi:hypothetical protein